VAPSTGEYPAGRGAVAATPPDFTEAAESMARALVARPAEGTGTRDLGPDVEAPQTFPQIDPNDPELQRSLWTTLFQVAAPAVVAAIDAFTGQQRAAGVPVSDGEDRVRSITSFLSDIGGKLWDAVPDLIGVLAQQAVANRDVPQPDDEQAQSRWIFSLVSALAPVVVPAVTDMVNGLFGKRAADQGGTAPTISLLSGEMGGTVGRDLFGTLFGAATQALPQIIDLLVGQRSRDPGLNLSALTGRTYDGDLFNVVETDLGDPSVIEFSLAQPYNTWWKQIEVMAGDTVIGAMWCQDGRHEDGPVRVRVDQLRVGGHLRLSKAKFWGIHTAMYEVYQLDQKAGKSLRIEWLDD
jgi:hypothetical protein